MDVELMFGEIYSRVALKARYVRNSSNIYAPGRGESTKKNLLAFFIPRSLCIGGASLYDEGEYILKRRKKEEGRGYLENLRPKFMDVRGKV